MTEERRENDGRKEGKFERKIYLSGEEEINITLKTAEKCVKGRKMSRGKEGKWKEIFS